MLIWSCVDRRRWRSARRGCKCYACSSQTTTPTSLSARFVNSQMWHIDSDMWHINSDIWHIYDIHGLILALAFRGNSLLPFTLSRLHSEQVGMNESWGGSTATRS